MTNTKRAAFCCTNSTGPYAALSWGTRLEEIKRDLDEVLQRGPKNGEWVRQPDPKKAKILIDWLGRNRAALTGWIEANQIELPETGSPTNA